MEWERFIRYEGIPKDEIERDDGAPVFSPNIHAKVFIEVEEHHSFFQDELQTYDAFANP